MACSMLISSYWVASGYKYNVEAMLKTIMLIIMLIFLFFYLFANKSLSRHHQTKLDSETGVSATFVITHLYGNVIIIAFCILLSCNV